MIEYRSKFQDYPKILILLLGLLMFSGLSQLRAQSFDYESHPKLDFDFTSLELTLGLQPQNLRLNGAANYQIKANISGADTVILYAARLDISSVSVDGNEAEFMLRNDSLFVPLGQPSEWGQAYELSIRYSASPRFGLLKNSNSTVWTSRLPQTQRHWVPIVDNPRLSFKTTLNISVPSGFDVSASGSKTGKEAVSKDVVTYHFVSDQAIPASDLAFSIGYFNQDSTVSGDTQINLTIEKSLSDSIETKPLLQAASDYLAKVEEELQLNYPYKELDIMLFEDHNWETKSWGTSTVFLYKNRGDLQTQLARGIIAQWFGSLQRVRQWSEADAINLYQSIVEQSVSDSTALLKDIDQPEISFTTVYDNFGVQRWNEWQKGFADWEKESLKAIISKTKTEVVKELPEVISWNDYAEFWYRKSGQPLFSAPDFTVPVADTVVEQKSDSVSYKVDYELNMAEGSLTLNFSAIKGSYSELTTLAAYEVYPGKVDTSEVTFTGTNDSVVLKVSPMINTLRLEAPNNPELHLDEYKPANFLIYELRNGDSIEQRARAARKMGYHADNPDLQLAITDFMNRETNPVVKAALLSSLADITKGASGTAQVFINASDSKYQQVRDAALMALQNYKSNPAVLSHVEQLAVNAEDIETFKKAAKVLATIASAEEYGSFVESLAGQALNRRAVFAIQQQANMGKVGEAVKRATLFLDSKYDYEIRSTALKIIIHHNQSAGDWLSRAQELLTDTDPRIRFLTVSGFTKNLNAKAKEFLKEYMQDEYDARVYYRIERLFDSNE